MKIKTRVEDIDSQKGLVRLSDDSSLPFDILVMATGADAVRLDIPGADLDGVFVLRNLTDALRLKSYLNEKECRQSGHYRRRLHRNGDVRGHEKPGDSRRRSSMSLPRPVIRWDAEFAKMIVDELGKNSVPFLPETRPLAIEKGTASRLVLKTDKGDLDADVILMGVGTRRDVDPGQGRRDRDG